MSSTWTLPVITLERFAYTPVGTFGRFTLPEFQCYSVERPWRNNAPRESCIPEGQYKLIKGRFHRGNYDCYELQSVPGRSLIKIHRGNTMEDVVGCIALGSHLGFIHGLWAVTSSVKTYNDFMRTAEAHEPKLIHVTSTQQGRL